jgi:hypothetical protein
MPQYVYFKDIYFGKNSVVKIFPHKEKLEDYIDYDAIAIAFFLDISDFLNQDVILTHLAYHDGNILRPVLMEWNKQTILGRVRVLLDLSLNYDKQLGPIIKRFMDQIDLIDNQIKGVAMNIAQSIAFYRGLGSIAKQIYDRIYYLKSIGIIRPIEEVRRIQDSFR